MRHRVLAIVVLGGLITFLSQIIPVISKIQSWEVIWNPPNVAQILTALVAALTAIAASLGLNLGELIKGFSTAKAEDVEKV